ncbi:hypothetical protein BT69DRAFT_1348695 [Atractiella rhizophila]|nr:hypothetical protein BT69DRAFT_1348695 [Atractiella rhizophila]
MAAVPPSENGHRMSTVKEPLSDTDSNSPGGHGLTRQLTVTLTPEQYERLFLQPAGTAPSRGDLAKRFGNPTVLGLAAFLTCLTPTSLDLMLFRGATSASQATLIGAQVALGGICMYLAGIMEWILGNTFPFVVFTTFGGYWLAAYFLFAPSQSLVSAFAEGADSVPYNIGLGYYFLTWGLLVFVYLIASLRTNGVFILLFFSLDIGFFLLTGIYFNIVDGGSVEGITKAAGACFFVTILCGWWLLMATLFPIVELPIRLPVFDTSSWFARPRKTKS